MAILEKAHAYAFLMLKFRLRSEYELRERLKRKDFPEAIIQETLAFLKEKRFVDDLEFARAWANSRLRRQIGERKIRQELLVKGVDKKIIESTLGSLSEEYSEKEAVKEIIKRRSGRLKGIEPLKARRRMYEYLMRRGFSADIILEELPQRRS